MKDAPKKSPQTLVLGIGNPYRGDDSIGRKTLEELKKQIPENDSVIFKEHSGEMTGLLSSWEDFDRVIVIDAVHSGETPGTTFEFNLAKESLPAQWRQTSTHGWGLAEALELGKNIGNFPKEFYFFGVEGESFEVGDFLSEKVQEGILQIIPSIGNKIRQ